MKKIIEYIIVYAEHYKMPTEINERIEAGWQPFGSPFIYTPSTNGIIAQAMVKYENKNTRKNNQSNT